MNKFFLVVLFFLFSLNLFAQGDKSLNNYIKRQGLVKLTDTAHLSPVLKMEYFFIKNYFLINKLEIQDYYVPLKISSPDDITYTIPLHHIEGIKILKAIEDKNTRLIKSKKPGRRVKLTVPPMGNVSGKDGSLIINVSNTEMEFVPIE